MAQLVKSIVIQLSGPPFNLSLTSVSLNALQPGQLLQLLSDVLCEIESRDRIDITDEPAENLALRLLTSLQIFKYQPELEDPDEFRAGLISGRPEIIHPIIHWLLQRREELKKRAYLSRFLVKIDIAPEMRSDSDVIDLYEQYEQLIEDFKQIHKQYDASQTINNTVSDLRKDIQSMEDDREVLVRRIERTQRKVENVANYNQLLTMAKKLRAEKDKNREFQSQKEEQKSYLAHLESRRQRMQSQLAENRQVNANATGQGLIQRAEDAIRVHQFMIQDKLKKEIQQKSASIALMEKVLTSPTPNSNDIQLLHQKIDDLRAKLSIMSEKRALENDPIEDGLALYRQQCAIVFRKKDSCAERLNHIRQELANFESQLQAKKQQLGVGQNESAVLTGDQFKIYVSDLRVKSNIYKERRTELNDLKAEYGILSRTLEVLKGQQSVLSDQLDRVESKQGVRGFRETREILEKVSDEKATTDEEKGRTLEEMSNLVRILNSKIADKKEILAPLLRELRPLRQKHQESLPEYEAKKRDYDSQVQMIEKTISNVIQAKSELESEIVLLEERRNQLQSGIIRNQEYLKRAADEMKLYVSTGASGLKGQSMRDQLQNQIAEQEKLNNQLRLEHSKLKENLPKLDQQLLYWERLEKIFKAKMLSQEKEKRQEGTVKRERGRETLVLQ